ncbi:MAG: (R)-specific enoyl-CoA hydratase [Nitrosomonadaceae bacterium]|nr:(R)-specific enoyl-CoA hydratase [Nitrosomonadaceae bacterium]
METISEFDAIEIGRSVRVSKTVGETDIYLFAGVSGDFAPVHVNEEHMKGTPYGKRIAHGALIVAFMSWASTKFMEAISFQTVSYGYDKIRFVKPVFIGDTVTIEYVLVEKITEKTQLRSQVTATNQRGEVVTVATHILQYIKPLSES